MIAGTSTATRPPVTPSPVQEQKTDPNVGLLLVWTCVVLLVIGVFLMIFGDGGRNR